jgi:ribonuclease HII
MLSPLPTSASARSKAVQRPADPAGAHIGVDEAGRGCLAGPIVASAVFFQPGFDFATFLPGLADSKKLSDKQRSTMTPVITRQARAYGIGISWQDEIDRVNVLNATFRAMSRAILALSVKLQDAYGPDAYPALPQLVIDGNYSIPLAEWQACIRGVSASSLAWEQYLPLPPTRLPGKIPALPEQNAVVGADSLIPSVSAASVLAKTVRDGLLIRLDEFYPNYGFAQHKGYGTKEHLAVLARKGPCPLHRRSFKHVLPQQKQYPLL